jgi:hypothetical protein
MAQIQQAVLALDGSVHVAPPFSRGGGSHARSYRARVLGRGP